MTLDELSALAARETQRQADVARQAGRDGGIYDRLLGRWIDWSTDEGPAPHRPGPAHKPPKGNE